jgi:uncharacterized membrane protein YfcA
MLRDPPEAPGLGVETPVLAALVLVAGLAGFVDAIAGGGGLLQLPALVVAGLPLSNALGVNKTSSICGTTAAIVRYARNGNVRWRVVAIAGPLAALASLAGASAILHVAREAAKAAVPAFAACLLALAVHQAWRAFRPPVYAPARESRPVLGYAFATAVGLYDGFIGPGTGMFLFWGFTTLLSLAPLDATGTTKAINGLTNVGALAVLIPTGHVIWPLALSMAAANLVGGWAGAHVAIRRGVRFVRLTTALVSAAASAYLIFRDVILRP